MDISELEYSIRKSLRKEFDLADRDRQIEIHKTFKGLTKSTFKSFNFAEDVEETRSDILSDHNINLY